MKTAVQTAIFIVSFVPFTIAVEVQNKSFTFNGVERSYRLGIPEASDSTPSLVLMFHGATSNNNIVLARTKILDLADEFGIVVAAPNAANDWFGGPQDSPEFIDALLDDIRSQTGFNDDGVGAMGMSQGGVFSQVLAATRPNVIKAAANVAGGLLEVPLGSRQVPIIDIQGTVDVVAPYPGGPGVLGDAFLPLPAIETIETFAAHNQCDLTPVETMLPDIEPADGSTITLLSYPNCATYLGTDGAVRSADVLHYRVDGGGHSWPGDTNDVLGFPTNLDIDATRVILEQFAVHSLPVPEPSSQVLAFISMIVFALIRHRLPVLS